MTLNNQTLVVSEAGQKGLGVFAKAPFKIGVLGASGKPLSFSHLKSAHSFQIDVDLHAEFDKPARLINHSCDPNLGIINNQFRGYDFIALRDIKQGEELGWDYCTTEFISIAIRDKCLCGSKICRVKISGFCDLPEFLKKKYEPFIASYLRQLHKT